METTTIKLKDGRSLAYEQYGDLKGKPVFFFHGTPGSRFFRPPDEITMKLGARLITVDRPGYGESSFQPKRKMLDWPKDIVQLADFLKLEKFHLAGHSGGGPYVLACTHELRERVISAVTVSGAGPPQAIVSASGISTINRLGLQFGRFIPWIIWKILVFSIFNNRRKDPWKDMDQQERNRPLADSLLMNDPKNRHTCFISELEAFKPGLLGLAWDTHLLSQEWGFHLGDIQVPVCIWHGSADNQAPLSMAQSLVDKIPSSTSRFLLGEGHLLLFKYWEDILNGLLTTHG
jgi:pimeloyl-ACP methyl ester carboxylesterase